MKFTTVITPSTATDLLSKLRVDGQTSIWYRYTSKYFFGLILRSEIPLEEIAGNRNTFAMTVKVHKKLSKRPDGTTFIGGWNVDLTVAEYGDQPEAPQVEIQIESFSSTLIGILEPTESIIICQDARGGAIGVVKFLPV